MSKTVSIQQELSSISQHVADLQNTTPFLVPAGYFESFHGRLMDRLLKESADVSIFACGHLVWKAIEAARILKEKGIHAEVINIHTIKPLDTEAVIASIQKTGCAVTAEEHNVLGGLGDSIAQTAAKSFPIPIEMVGTQDTFGESGKPTELLKKYGLDTEFIVAAAEKAMSRKKV